MQFSATDDDSGNNGIVDYSLVWSSSDGEQLFEVVQEREDPEAELYTLIEFDREDPEPSAVVIGKSVKYGVTVEATDRGTPPLSTTCFFFVEIEDVNDNVPYFDLGSYRGRIMDEEPTGDARVLRVFAVDDDNGENATVSYHLEDDGGCSGCFTIERETGWLIQQVSVSVRSVPVFSFQDINSLQTEIDLHSIIVAYMVTRQ